MSPVRSNECPSLELPGVGNPRTIRDLAAFVQSYNPKMVFLSETRQSEENESVALASGFERMPS